MRQIHEWFHSLNFYSSYRRCHQLRPWHGQRAEHQYEKKFVASRIVRTSNQFSANPSISVVLKIQNGNKWNCVCLSISLCCVLCAVFWWNQINRFQSSAMRRRPENVQTTRNNWCHRDRHKSLSGLVLSSSRAAIVGGMRQSICRLRRQNRKCTREALMVDLVGSIAAEWFSPRHNTQRQRHLTSSSLASFYFVTWRNEQ